MTLIVSVVTWDVVFQVSDRRVTLVYPDGRSMVREEPLTKSVLFCDRAIFGFTGLAECHGQRSDLWIAEQLRDVQDLNTGFEVIRQRLTELFRFKSYQKIPHTVTATGFQQNEDFSLTPFYATITNQIRDGAWLPMPTPDFRVHIGLLKPKHVGVFAAPNWMTDVECQQLLSAVASSDDLGRAIAHVVDAVRAVAARQPAVGADLLLSVLPRGCVGRHEVVWVQGALSDEIPSFFYLPLQSEAIQHGPTFVCGGSVLTNVQGGALTDDDQERTAAAAREFHRAHRPQRAYLVPVVHGRDEQGRLTRRPDLDRSVNGTFYYNPDGTLSLVLTTAELLGFQELTTLEQIRKLCADWDNALDPSHVSEVTVIGWEE